MFLHSNSTEDLQICRANRSSAPLSKLLLFAHEAGKFLIGKMVGTLWIMPSLINEYTWAIMNKVTWWSKPSIPKFLGNILEGTNLFLSNPPKKNTRIFTAHDFPWKKLSTAKNPSFSRIVSRQIWQSDLYKSPKKGLSLSKMVQLLLVTRCWKHVHFLFWKIYTPWKWTVTLGPENPTIHFQVFCLAVSFREGDWVWPD